MTRTRNISRWRTTIAAARWPLGLFAIWAAAVASADPLNGTFEIRNAAIEHNDQAYFFSAQVEFPIDDSVRDALRQGLPLKLELEVEVSRPRRFWPDATLATAGERYELTYHAVTDRYRVDKGVGVPANADQATYDDFETAIAALGRIDKLPIALVADVDDAHAARLGRGQYRRDVAAAERKHEAHAVRRERRGYALASVRGNRFHFHRA